MPGTFTYTVATNIVQVTGGTSGAPATFADFVANDRAGTGTVLKAASAPSATFTLTYPVRPVELRAIPVKFIVASKTAEADYLFITGTDAWDAAQTESIDVSAGNGSYTSTKRWRTITNIDCSDNAAGGGTVWADGTLSVTQDIWGVIWDYGNKHYRLDAAQLQIAASGISTYFADDSCAIELTHYADYSTAIRVVAGGTLRLGKCDDVIDRITYNGCFIKDVDSNYNECKSVCNDYGTMYLYGCFFLGAQARKYVGLGSATYKSYAWNCSFGGSCVPISNYDTFNCNMSKTTAGWTGVGNFMDRINLLEPASVYAFYINTSITVKNIYGRNIGNVANYAAQICYFINCDLNSWTFQGTTIGGNYYRQFTFNLELQDKDGVAQAGKVVKMVNDNGDTVFEETTDANGNITFSGQHSSPESNAVSYKRYYYSGSAQTQDYSPFKLYIDGAHVATYGSDDVESWEANGGANLVGPIGGGGGSRFVRLTDSMVSKI